MLNLLQEMLNFVLTIGGTAVDLVGAIFTFALNMITIFHTEMPRAEGFVIGVLLAWFMAKRENHPILKVLSTPLKLTLDILDLLWDQVAEMLKDSWELVIGAIKKSYNLFLDKAKKAYELCVSFLKKLKLKSKAKKDSED